MGQSVCPTCGGTGKVEQGIEWAARALAAYCQIEGTFDNLSEAGRAYWCAEARKIVDAYQGRP